MLQLVWSPLENFAASLKSATKNASLKHIGNNGEVSIKNIGNGAFFLKKVMF
jgi:hypothetical protein